MKKLLVSLAMTSILVSSVSGCASMFHGTSQQIAIRSNVPGSELYVNEAYVGRDNAITTFQKRQNYVVTARKAGCIETTVPASKSFDAITLLGVLIDYGIISVLIVDGAATGAWTQFDQTNFVVDPRCTDVAEEAARRSDYVTSMSPSAASRQLVSVPVASERAVPAPMVVEQPKSLAEIYGSCATILKASNVPADCSYSSEGSEAAMAISFASARDVNAYAPAVQSQLLDNFCQSAIRSNLIGNFKMLVPSSGISTNYNCSTAAWTAWR